MDDDRWSSAVRALLIADVNETENPAAPKCSSAMLTHVYSLMDNRRLSVTRRDIHAVLKESCSPKPGFYASQAYLSDRAFSCNNTSTTLAMVRQQCQRRRESLNEKLVQDRQSAATGGTAQIPYNKS